MRRSSEHRVAIYKAPCVEHTKAVTFKCCLLRGSVPCHSDEVENRIDWFHGRFRRTDFTHYPQSIEFI